MLSFLSSVKMLEGYGQVCVRVNEYQHIRSKKLLGEHMLVSTSFPEAYLLHDAESLHVPNNDGD